MTMEFKGKMNQFLDKAFEHRFRNFLILLILTLLSLPLEALGNDYQSITLFFTSLTIIAGSFAMSRERMFLRLAVLVAIPAILARWITFAFYTDVGDISGMIFSIMFFAVFLLFLLKVLLRSKRITGDTILGAISIYLLIGITFAFGYQLVDHVVTGAFDYNMVMRPEGLSLVDFIYYSFITMTTLGYGDITPLNGLVESMAYLEAVTGTLFTVIFIARLVSSYQRPRSLPDEGHQGKADEQQDTGDHGGEGPIPGDVPQGPGHDG